MSVFYEYTNSKEYICAYMKFRDTITDKCRNIHLFAIFKCHIQATFIPFVLIIVGK